MISNFNFQYECGRLEIYYIYKFLYMSKEVLIYIKEGDTQNVNVVY